MTRRAIKDQYVEGKVACGNIQAEDFDVGGVPVGHTYHIDYSAAAGPLGEEAGHPAVSVSLDFQRGPIEQGGVGVNGIQNEDLIAIVIDRLRGFQAGEFRCRENAITLTYLEEALMWSQKRTRDRMSRGVEGSHQK